MTVEIDVLDIPFGSFYTDERCKRVERIIQRKEEYAEFRVKRYRGEEDPTLDTYVIMDVTENFWVWMYEWEVDALSDSEILSYVTVTKETSQRPDPTQNLMIVTSLFAALFLSFIIIVAFVPEFPVNDIIIGIALVSLVASLISGWIFKVRHEAHMQNEREFEIEIMRSHPLFLEAIRKFAALQDINESNRERYLKRIQEIESGMTS